MFHSQAGKIILNDWGSCSSFTTITTQLLEFLQEGVSIVIKFLICDESFVFVAPTNW